MHQYQKKSVSIQSIELEQNIYYVTICSSALCDIYDKDEIYDQMSHLTYKDRSNYTMSDVYSSRNKKWNH